MLNFLCTSNGNFELLEWKYTMQFNKGCYPVSFLWCSSSLPEWPKPVARKQPFCNCLLPHRCCCCWCCWWCWLIYKEEVSGRATYCKKTQEQTWARHCNWCTPCFLCWTPFIVLVWYIDMRWGGPDPIHWLAPAHIWATSFLLSTKIMLFNNIAMYGEM